MQRVEFKSELRDVDLARGICARMGATREVIERQVDTYYRLADGRLKKREVSGRAPSYIFYHRPNRLRATLCHVTVYDERQAAERFGERGLPVWLSVEKERETWVYKNVRVHLDEVEGLGTFLEIEAGVGPSCHVGECHILVTQMREALRACLGEPLSLSYSDMVAREPAGA